jgi:hypothetical protein
VLAGLVAAGSSAGCQWLFAWAVAPRHPMQTVKAEYNLEAERLVIIPYVGTDILFTYPAAPLEVGGELVNAIVRDLRGRVKTIVHPVEVVRWQESTLEWPTMSLERIAEEFQADTLLYVELGRYTMVEERSANLFRGRAKARIEVVKVGAEHNPVYDAVVEVIFPEDQPVGVLETSERVIRQGTNILLARDILRKFHDHKIEVKGGEP